MKNLELEKRKHSIAEWTLTSVFVIAMIATIFSMKGLMASNRELFLSVVIGLIVLFTLAKIQLFKWGKGLEKQEK